MKSGLARFASSTADVQVDASCCHCRRLFTDTRPGTEQLIRGTVEVAHVAAGVPLDAFREAVCGQWPDDQFHCESLRVDVDGCQRFARTAPVGRHGCQHSCQAMNCGVSGRAQQPVVGPPEFGHGLIYGETYQGHRLGLFKADVGGASLAVHVVKDQVVLAGAACEVGDLVPGLVQLLGGVIAVHVLESQTRSDMASSR